MHDNVLYRQQPTTVVLPAQTNWLFEFLEFRNETEAVTHLSASAIQQSLKGCSFSVATRRILCDPLQGHTEYVLSVAFQRGWEDAGSSRFPWG